MNKLLVLIVLGVTTMAISQTVEYETRKPKVICKVSRLGTHDIAVTCLNGSDPTGRKAGDVLLISCGK